MCRGRYRESEALKTAMAVAHVSTDVTAISVLLNPEVSHATFLTDSNSSVIQTQKSQPSNEGSSQVNILF
jgi:hypothetical protein